MFAQHHRGVAQDAQAGLLAWQGALLSVLGSTGTVNLTNKVIVGIANSRLPVWLGFVLAGLGILGYAAVVLGEYRGRQAAGLPVQSTTALFSRIAIIAVATVVPVTIN